MVTGQGPDSVRKDKNNREGFPPFFGKITLNFPCLGTGCPLRCNLIRVTEGSE